MTGSFMGLKTLWITASEGGVADKVTVRPPRGPECPFARRRRRAFAPQRSKGRVNLGEAGRDQVKTFGRREAVIGPLHQTEPQVRAFGMVQQA